MHGIGLEADVREWFDPRPTGRGNGARKQARRRAAPSVPATSVPSNLIERYLA
jgi:hypothetical protein